MAEKDYEVALKMRPDNAEALNTLAYSWTEKGKNLVKAEAMLRRALIADPMAPHIIDSLGWVAEFRIPLGQLRYQEAGEHRFGFQVTREVARTNERSTWPLSARSTAKPAPFPS